MRVTRVADAPPYHAASHRDVLTVRMQGHQAGYTEGFWVGLSTYGRGALAEYAAVPEETVYVVLDGALVIRADGVETVLGRLDSVHLVKGEMRSIENRFNSEALLLVAMAQPPTATRLVSSSQGVLSGRFR